MSAGTQGVPPGSERDKRARRHFETAKHNEDWVALLERDVLPLDPSFLDWAIVGLFYSALHYASGAIMRDHGEAATGHKELLELIRQHLPHEVASYKNLFDHSYQARYFHFWKRPQSMGWQSLLNLLRHDFNTMRNQCLAGGIP